MTLTRSPTPSPRPRRLAWLPAAAALMFLFAAVAAPQARADFGIADFDGAVLDSNGDPFTQAGAHPWSASTSFAFNTHIDENGISRTDDDARNIHVELPPGVVGNAQALPKCTQAELGQGSVAPPECPTATQVGTAKVALAMGDSTPTVFNIVPVYNMVAPPGVPAQFAFQAAVEMIHLDASVRPRTGDYGISIDVNDISQAAGLIGSKVIFWGVPADPRHNSERFCPGDTSPGGCTTNAPEQAFFTLPTACLGPLTTTMRADTWQDPGNFDKASFVSHDNDTPPNPIGVSGCDSVPFDPEMTIWPTSHRAGSPAGLDVEIEMPTEGLLAPDGVSQANLKRVEVTLPDGMVVNPSSADGLGACSEAEIGLGDSDSPECPASSKIGSVQIETPLLTEPLSGSVYLAEQGNKGPAQGSNPFGSLLALYLVAESKQRGLTIKLPGKVSPDPETGQLVATFDDNPQLPFSKFRIHFKSGPRAPLVTPPTCGTYEVTSELSPWSAADPDNPTAAEVAIETSSFTIDKAPDGGPCVVGDPSEPGDPADLADRPFDPEMVSGVINPVAGSFSPFVFRLTRQDGEQEILSTEVTPPEGVTGKLAGIPLCSDSDAEAGTCSEDSKVGEAIVGAGAGPSPFYIQGDDAGSVYLSGPYKGAPLSLLIQVPAVAGPFDLGMVDVRAALHVDPRTAQLNVISDPIPQILEGIPLRVKDIRIKMNREGFTIAPTDCDPKQVTGIAHGSRGAEANLANRFQVGDCASLGFEPKLRLAYKGKGAKKRNSHPRLDANLTVPGAEAILSGAGATQTNLSKVRVTLPKGTFLDQDSLETICTRPQWAADECPEEALVGHAKAWSPLLDEPLEGPVYLKSSDNLLPDLAADLNGIVDIDLFGRIDQSHGRIRNTFDVVPDVAVSQFKLSLDGGDGGLLVNSKDICGGKKKLRRANIAMNGQNEARLRDKQNVVRCGGKKRKRKRHNRRHR